MQRVKSYRFWQTQILWYCFILFLCMQSYHRLIMNASCHVTLGPTRVNCCCFCTVCSLCALYLASHAQRMGVISYLSSQQYHPSFATSSLARLIPKALQTCSSILSRLSTFANHAACPLGWHFWRVQTSHTDCFYHTLYDCSCQCCFWGSCLYTSLWSTNQFDLPLDQSQGRNCSVPIDNILIWQQHTESAAGWIDSDSSVFKTSSRLTSFISCVFVYFVSSELISFPVNAFHTGTQFMVRRTQLMLPPLPRHDPKKRWPLEVENPWAKTSQIWVLFSFLSVLRVSGAVLNFLFDSHDLWATLESFRTTDQLTQTNCKRSEIPRKSMNTAVTSSYLTSCGPFCCFSGSKSPNLSVGRALYRSAEEDKLEGLTEDSYGRQCKPQESTHTHTPIAGKSSDSWNQEQIERS